jgi:hypothetical protein
MMKRVRLALFVGLLLAGTAIGAKAQVVMRGDVDYWTYGSRVRFEVDDITNLSDQPTDRLRLILWASEDPWEDFDRGRILGLAALPRLGPNQNLDDVHRTTHLYRIPSGWYYVTLTLAERTVDENGLVRWVIRDKVEFDDRRYFSRRSPLPLFPF